MNERTIANSKILETNRLMLRPWKEEDAEALFKYAAEPEVGISAGWKPHESVEESLKIIQTVLSTAYAVVLKETMEPIGSIGLMIGKESSLALPRTEAEIGFWIGKPYWGQRLIPEACIEVMRYGFEEIGMRRLWCCYFEGNARSRRTQEKCGFRYRFTEDDRFYPEMDERRTENASRMTLKEWRILSAPDGPFAGGRPTVEQIKNLEPINLCDAETLDKRLRLHREEGQGARLVQGDISLQWNLSDLSKRISQGNLTRELLVRAAKLKDYESPLVWDATAGLGVDSLLLAAAGAEVKLFEYDPVVSTLLMDAINRAKDDAALKDIAGRMDVVVEDSVVEMNALGRDADKEVAEGEAGGTQARRRPDIIYLDPMFPERKKSGLVKKKFQLLQQLENPCDDEEELLNAAIAAEPKKIIIKRPAKAPYLAGHKPGYSIEGDIIRFDCIVL